MNRESPKNLSLELKKKAAKLRLMMVEMLRDSEASGHYGGGMSVMDILTVLYFKVMNIDPVNPDWPDRDRFVLSKGHACCALCPVLAEKGYLSTDILEALINKTIDKEFEKEHYLSERLIFIENDENLRFIKLKKDVRTVLQYLSDREIPIAIATLSRGISRVINILRMFDIYDYFFEIQCREVNSKAKLLENEKICIKEKMYTTILSKNIHRHDLSIVIGDSTCDVVASTNLGLISFGVSGDYIVQPGLAQIVRVLQSLNELITLIN